MTEPAEVYYKLEREAKLTTSPKPKATISQTLPADQKVKVLQRKHRWIQIEFLPEKGDPQKGWLLKKYAKLVKK